MTTPSSEVQWRQGANGVWEYLASDGNWYPANPAAGTPVPPGGWGAPPAGQTPPYSTSAPVYAPAGPATVACPRCGTYFDPKRRACPNCSAINGFPQMELASVGIRFGQYLLDFLLAIVTLIIGYLIWSFIIWGRGQTPAMQILHIRVVKKDTLERTGWGTMALREVVGKWLVFSLINAVPGVGTVAAIVLDFMLLWDDDRQELWDKIAKTIVVVGDPTPPGFVPAQLTSGVPGALPTNPQPFTAPQPVDTTVPVASGPLSNPQPTAWEGSAAEPGGSEAGAGDADTGGTEASPGSSTP